MVSKQHRGNQIKKKKLPKKLSSSKKTWKRWGLSRQAYQLNNQNNTKGAEFLSYKIEIFFICIEKF